MCDFSYLFPYETVRFEKRLILYINPPTHQVRACRGRNLKLVSLNRECACTAGINSEMPSANWLKFSLLDPPYVHFTLLYFTLLYFTLLLLLVAPGLLLPECTPGCSWPPWLKSQIFHTISRFLKMVHFFYQISTFSYFEGWGTSLGSWLLLAALLAALGCSWLLLAASG